MPPLTWQGNGVASGFGSIPYQSAEGQGPRLGHLHVIYVGLTRVTDMTHDMTRPWCPPSVFPLEVARIPCSHPTSFPGLTALYLQIPSDSYRISCFEGPGKASFSTLCTACPGHLSPVSTVCACGIGPSDQKSALALGGGNVVQRKEPWLWGQVIHWDLDPTLCQLCDSEWSTFPLWAPKIIIPTLQDVKHLILYLAHCKHLIGGNYYCYYHCCKKECHLCSFWNDYISPE